MTRRPCPDLHDGVAVQRLLTAAELSSAEGRWVFSHELHE